MPQGFTLTVAGTLAVMVTETREPRALDVCLFVVAASFTLMVLRLAAASIRSSSQDAMPASLAVFNVIPVVAVPLCGAAGRVPGPDAVGFCVAGASAPLLYVTGLSWLVRLLIRHEEGTGPKATSAR